MANTTNFSIETPTVGGYRNTWGGTINTGLSRIDELLALAMPVGTIQMYPKTTAPTATANGGTWLVCDGSTLVRTDYPDLHTLITNTYGTYPSGSTFVLPDLRARVPVGYNASAIGSGVTVRSGRAIAANAGGTEGHIITTGELSAHSHSIPTTVHSHSIVDKSHAHVGLREDAGAGTEDVTLAVTDSGHFHSVQIVDVWRSEAGQSNAYSPQKGVSTATENPSTSTATTGITIADHKHTFATDSVPTGLAATEDGVTNINSTSPDTGSDSSHNNMPPFVVVNYIILAKHPTFT